MEAVTGTSQYGKGLHGTDRVNGPLDLVELVVENRASILTRAATCELERQLMAYQWQVWRQLTRRWTNSSRSNQRSFLTGMASNGQNLCGVSTQCWGPVPHSRKRTVAPPECKDKVLRQTPKSLFGN